MLTRGKSALRPRLSTLGRLCRREDKRVCKKCKDVKVHVSVEKRVCGHAHTYTTRMIKSSQW